MSDLKVGEPFIAKVDRRYAIKRKVRGDGEEYYNGARDEWIPSERIHGGSAQNPKASFYGHEVAVKVCFVLTAKWTRERNERRAKS